MWHLASSSNSPCGSRTFPLSLVEMRAVARRRQLTLKWAWTDSSSSPPCLRCRHWSTFFWPLSLPNDAHWVRDILLEPPSFECLRQQLWFFHSSTRLRQLGLDTEVMEQLSNSSQASAD